MQPTNNPTSVIGSLPGNSFGGAPQQQAPQQAPVDFSQFATVPAPQQQTFMAPPVQQQPDIFGAGAQPQAPQPWVPQPVQQNPQQPVQQQQPQYIPQQQPAVNPNEPPAWASELKQMLEQQQPQQQQSQSGSTKPRSWDEVKDWAREAAEQTFREKEEQQRMQEQAQEQQVQSIMQDLDNQLTQLSQLNQIPAVADPNNPNDTGRAYRRELLALANATGSTNLNVLNQNLIMAHRAGNVFDPNTNAFVPAGQAGAAPTYASVATPPPMGVPLAGGAGAVGGAPQDALPSLHDLRSRSLSELAAGLNPQTASYIG